MVKALLVEETTGEVTEVPVETVDKNWYRRPANFQLGQFDKDLETKREKSLTIPDQSYTVREILQKFTRGIPLDVGQEGDYENPEELTGEEPEKAIDITDVEEQLGFLNKKIAAAKQSKVKGVVKGAEELPPDITEESKTSDASKTE